LHNNRVAIIPHFLVLCLHFTTLRCASIKPRPHWLKEKIENEANKASFENKATVLTTPSLTKTELSKKLFKPKELFSVKDFENEACRERRSCDYHDISLPEIYSSTKPK